MIQRFFPCILVTVATVALGAAPRPTTTAVPAPWDGKTQLLVPRGTYYRCVLSGNVKAGPVLLHLALRDNAGSRAYLSVGGEPLRMGEATGVARSGDEISGKLVFPPSQATMRAKLVADQELTLSATIAGGKVTGKLSAGEMEAQLTGTIQSEDEIRKAQPVSKESGWTAWAGPRGDFSAVDAKVPMVEKLTDARLVWASEEHVWGGRGSPKDWQVGGYSSPIIGGGLVFLNMFEGSGDVKVTAESLAERNSQGKAVRGQVNPCIAADDIIIAVDAATGQLVWKQRMLNASANSSGSKHVYLGMNGAYHNGKYYTYGFTRRIYCFEAATGKLLWHSNIGPAHEEAEQQKAIGLQKKMWIRLEGPFTTLDVADGIPFCGNMRGQVIAFDPETGKVRWTTKGDLPTKWLHQGKQYIVLSRSPLTADHAIIEPATGKELLAFKAGVPMISQGVLALSGEYLLSKVPVAKDVKNPGRLMAHKVSLTGATQAWALDEDSSATHQMHPAVFAGDVFVLKTVPPGGKDKGDEAGGGRVEFRSLSSGKLIARQPFNFVSTGYGWSADGRFGLVGDTNHTESGGPRLFRVDNGQTKDAERWNGIHAPSCGYEMPMVHPYHDGRLFFRGMKYLVCYDLRAK